MKKLRLLLFAVLCTVGIFSAMAAPEYETVAIGNTGYATYFSSNALYIDGVYVPEPIGRWTFDDSSNLLAGTGSATLTATIHSTDGTGIVTPTSTPAGASITSVTGPFEGNGAVNVPVGSSLLMAANNGAESIGTYSVMFDVCVEDGSTYVPLMQNALSNNKDGSLFINQNHVGLGGGIGYHGSIENGKWYRIVFVVSPTEASLYVEGALLTTYNQNFDNPRGSYLLHWLLTTGALFFADNDGEEKAIKTSELRFWDVALDKYQVAEIGSISGDAPKFPEALGTWTFEDASNLTAGTGTATLAMWGSGVSAISGPDASNGAISAPIGGGFTLDTHLSESSNAYTLMLDVSLPDVSGYISLYQNDITNSKDGSIFIQNGQIGLNSAGLSYNGTINTNTWYRIVIVIDNGYCKLFVDGTQVGASVNPDANAWAMRDTKQFLLFVDNDGEEKEVKAAEVRFWDIALTATQVAELATVGTTIDDGETGGEEEAAPAPVAYTGKIGANVLSLTALEGGIPANTAVVLKGTPNTTHRFFVIPEGLPAVTDNDLLGSDGTVTGGPNIYVLSDKNGIVGFYLVSSSTTIPAHKAYLNTSAGVKGFTFCFDDDATGIEDLNANVNHDEAIYNLAGQRLQKMQKGINIVNGKKILR
ncbi:MAG: hypothetical protein J6W03_03510 [Bacteroidaceae bacterium]|nr:hypothetical protein [Bacteroidaceae bacterium]